MADGTLSACLAEIKASPLRFYVYVMSRPDGRPFYVGKGNGRRIWVHESHTRMGKRGIRFSIIRKIWYAGGAVAYQIASFHEYEADAFAAEMRLIAEIGRRENGGPLVNRTDGGEGPTGFTQEITPVMRAKISAALKGRKRAPEHIAATAASNLGKKRSPEFSAKLSAILKSPGVNTRMVAGRAGYRASDETRAKIRAVKLGLKASPETRAKMSASQRGKKRGEQARANIAAGALKRRPLTEERRDRLRAMRHAQAPLSDEAKRVIAEKMKAIRAEKKWGVSEEQRRQISESLKARNAALRP